MSWYSREEQRVEDIHADAPVYVRQAALRMRRTTEALFVYRRRGWNPSAAKRAARDAREEYIAAMEQWYQEQMNPTLF